LYREILILNNQYNSLLMSGFKLFNRPDWQMAAQRLVSGCFSLNTEDQRVELMESVCVGLGDELYPAFLHILCVIGQHGDHESRYLITDALVQSLLTGRLPSGKLAAWGASRFDPDALLGKTASLGPVEYLFIWYSQPSAVPPLPIQSFQQAAFDLLSLISSNTKAKRLYCKKLKSDIETPLDGCLTSKTKCAIEAFVQTWEADDSIYLAIDNFLDSLHGDSMSRLINI
jgi:hypothetical protein